MKYLNDNFVYTSFFFIMRSGHVCKENSVRSNTSDLDNSENYSNGTRNLDETTDTNVPEQRSLRHNSRTIKSGNGNGAGDNSSNESSEDDDDEDEEDDTLTTSSDENEVYSKNSKNNNGTDIKRSSQKRTSTVKSSIEHSSNKKTRRSSALSIDLNVADTTADAH